MIEYYYNKFLYGLRWGSFESIAYETLLLIHQIALCKVLGITEYGKVGTIISLIYLTARILNFGLDLSFAPFFKEAITSKHHFKKIVGWQVAIQAAIYIVGPYILYQIIIYFNVQTKLSSDIIGSALLLIAMLLTIASEAIQRTLKNILYLTFDNKLIALVTITKIIWYISFIWIMYACGLHLTPLLLTLPLLISELAAMYWYSTSVIHFYTTLPDSHDPLPQHILPRIIRVRAYSFITQIITQAYSSNFLIPTFALFFSMKQAGALTLVSSISYYITEIIKRTFGASSTAVFSHIKHSEHQDKQHLFGKISALLYYFLLLIGLIIFLHYKKCVHFFSPDCQMSDWMPAYLFLIIHFSEHFFLPYKKFFIAHEQSKLLSILETLDLVLVFASLQLWWSYSSTAAFVAVIGVRCMIGVAYVASAYYLWNIRPVHTALHYHYYFYPLIAFLSLTYFM